MKIRYKPVLKKAPSLEEFSNNLKSFKLSTEVKQQAYDYYFKHLTKKKYKTRLYSKEYNDVNFDKKTQLARSKLNLRKLKMQEEMDRLIDEG